jgi:chaperonin GroES
MEAKAKDALAEVVEPIGLRVLVRKDEDRKTTRGGIVLPGTVEIPVLTGRIVAISTQVENDPDYPIKQYDKVLVNPEGVVPVDLENDNKLFIIPVQNVVAVLRKEKREC